MSKQAQNGYNDDLVMSLGMGLFVRDTAMKFYQQSMELSRASVDGIVRTTAPAGFTSPGTAINPYQIDLGNGTVEDVTWVLG